MKNILILCGGESYEHEISLQSAMGIYQNISRKKYSPILVGITKNGVWGIGDPLILYPDDPSKIQLTSSLKKVSLENGIFNDIKIDCVFSVLHGSLGENGSLQGLLNVHHLPFVGADVLSSAVGMDKEISKKLFQQAGIQCARSITLYKEDLKHASYLSISKQLGSILFVKPSQLGSSVGVSKCKNEIEFQQAIEKAFLYDSKIIVEEFIQGREIEISILGNKDLQCSVPGEIIPQKDFYSYEAKYLDETGAILEIPAKLETNTIEKLQQIAKQATQVLDCEGMLRVDFFLTEHHGIYLNEINTLPGFTPISMYPKLWEASGIPYETLIDTLIELALERKRNKDLFQKN